MTTDHKILFVDDNADDIALFDIVLRENGIVFSSDTCEDGEEALRVLSDAAKRHELPALVVLDFNLPRKNGGEVLRVIKNDPALKSLPIVVMTTTAAPNELDALRKFPGVKCLTKPFLLNQFGPFIDAVRGNLAAVGS